MKNFLFIGLLLITALEINAQSNIDYNGLPINSLTEQNDKNGVWKIFKENSDISITCEYNNGKVISNTDYFKDSKLKASFNNVDKLLLYKDSLIINCKFKKLDEKQYTIVDENDIELDSILLEEFYILTDTRPVFYGGIQKLYEFIGNNFVSKGQKGKLKILFEIDSNGLIGTIEIKESTNNLLNEEALRVTKLFPRWQPSHQGGQFNSSFYLLPLTIN